MTRLKIKTPENVGERRATARQSVILELLEHARTLAADEDEITMAGHIDEAINACLRDQAFHAKPIRIRVVQSRKPL
jgi:hypothetical protein